MTPEEIKELNISHVKEMLGSACNDDLITWLIDKGYFECPAACKHHGAVYGGLYAHSLEVANQLINMTDKLGLTWQRKESPAIVGLLHDVCKLDDYLYEEHTYQLVTIKWNRNSLPGHGSKSIKFLKDHIELTDEETQCILNHMGAFTSKEKWSRYSEAVRKYPNVLYTHTADMIASQIIGK